MSSSSSSSVSRQLPIPVAINGFGRMGRLVLRSLYEYHSENVIIVHINDPKCSAATAAHLLTFDSVHGRWPVSVKVEDDYLIIGSVDVSDKRLWKISFSAESSPASIAWRDRGAEMIIESSGKFVTIDSLTAYDKNPSQSPSHIIVSAPVKGALNIVVGVNEKEVIEQKYPHIVTAASCTTNCLAPIVSVLLDKVGIIHGSMTTIHNVTNTQIIVDAPHADLRRARSCLTSLVPTSTGSATAIAMIFPELKGKINGLAVRVPLLNSSITDCAFELKRSVTINEIHQWMDEAANGRLKGILGVERLPLVSIDFVNDRRSSIIDATNTLVIDGTHLKILAWYDNEVGYANRLAELTVMMAKHVAMK